MFSCFFPTEVTEMIKRNDTPDKNYAKQIQSKLEYVHSKREKYPRIGDDNDDDDDDISQ